MKSISIHPFSALAGAGLLGLSLLAGGAVQTAGNVQPIPFSSGPVRIAGIPDPRQMVAIKEGVPLVVPPGKLLAVTGVGGTRDNVESTLRVDGVDEVSTFVRLPYGNSTTMGDLPPGCVANSGATVEVVSVGGVFGCAWGYFVDQQPTPGLVRVAGIPDPRSMVVIRQGTPFTVPSGQVLSITGVGSTAVGTAATLFIDGQTEFSVASNWSLGSESSVLSVPSGLAAAGGSIVAVGSGPGNIGRAWGYLADA